jgi:hypothetical protein
MIKYTLDIKFTNGDSSRLEVDQETLDTIQKEMFDSSAFVKLPTRYESSGHYINKNHIQRFYYREIEDVRD